jgi:hypothetical protein
MNSANEPVFCGQVIEPMARQTIVSCKETRPVNVTGDAAADVNGDENSQGKS